MFMSNKSKLDDEDLKEFKERRKAIRKEDTRDTFMQGVALVAPMALFVGGLWAAGSISAKKAEKKKNLEDDLTARGLGFEGRQDPAWFAAKWNRNNVNLIEEDDEEEDNDEE